MSKIVTAELDRIVPNPFRMLKKKYPYDVKKLAALYSSIEETGFWEGVMARRRGDEFQLAFGHHRIQAARTVGLETVPLIIRDLSDEQMLQLMGRENLEDYRTSFSVLLETWEAAYNFFRINSKKDVNDLEVAELLGWTSSFVQKWKNKDTDNSKTYEALNPTARATNAALNLIKGGYNTHAEFEGLTVSAAQVIVERGQALMKEAERQEKVALENKKLSEAAKEKVVKAVEQQKQRIGEGVRRTAKQMKAGEVSQKDLRGKVDLNAFEFGREQKRNTPLLSEFGEGLAHQIERMIDKDNVAQKLDAINGYLSQVVMQEDVEMIAEISLQLSRLKGRIQMRINQLSAHAQNQETVAVAVGSSTLLLQQGEKTDVI